MSETATILPEVQAQAAQAPAGPTPREDRPVTSGAASPGAGASGRKLAVLTAVHKAGIAVEQARESMRIAHGLMQADGVDEHLRRERHEVSHALGNFSQMLSLALVRLEEELENL